MNIKNLNIVKDIVRIFKLQSEDFQEDIPIVGNIPIYREIIIKHGQANNATSGTIYNIPAGRTLYLVGGNLTVIKDATSTSTSTILRGTLEETNSDTPLLAIPSITLTAQNQTVPLITPSPIKLKGGTSLYIANSTAVANIDARAVIYCYEE